MPGHLVCKANEKNKIKKRAESGITKHRSVLVNPFGLDGLGFIVNQKWMNKI